LARNAQKGEIGVLDGSGPGFESECGRHAVTGRVPAVAIVEDDEAVRDSLKLLLEAHGLQVDAYGSAREFLAERERHLAGCLLLDIHMSGMSGLELLRHLRSGADEIPAIVISGRADADLRRQALQAGALAVCEKPVDNVFLLGLIDGIASGRG
jgi:FixJ family two-component response regulator